jgi:hypothetical protein
MTGTMSWAETRCAWIGEKLREMSALERIGSITSQTASLTIVVFDASSAADWVPTKAAATKAQFTGHPAEVMRGLAKGEEATAIDVGASNGFAFELEGKSGKLDAYRAATGALVFVAPPREWWLERHPEAAETIDALLAQALSSDDDASELGEVELTSGKLAAVYLWLKKVGAARELATTIPSNGAVEFGDGYGDGNGGLIVDLGPGRYRLARHEIATPWDGETLVAVVFTAV